MNKPRHWGQQPQSSLVAYSCLASWCVAPPRDQYQHRYQPNNQPNPGGNRGANLVTRKGAPPAGNGLPAAQADFPHFSNGLLAALFRFGKHLHCRESLHQPVGRRVHDLRSTIITHSLPSSLSESMCLAKAPLQGFLLSLWSASLLYCLLQRGSTLTVAVNTTAHRTGSPVCGPQPGKEPLSDIDRAILIAIHDEAAVPTAIRALPQRHGLFAPTPAAGLARMAFIFGLPTLSQLEHTCR